jgi:hypothetical protein
LKEAGWTAGLVWTNAENHATTGMGFLYSPTIRRIHVQSSPSEGIIKKKRGTRNKYITKGKKKMKEILEYKSIGRNERIEGENMGMK